MKEITFEITNKCYNKCLHCSSKINGLQNKISLDIQIIKDICEKYKPEWVNLSGGEPTLHLYIYKIVEYLKSKNIKTRLYTANSEIDFLELNPDIIVFPYYSHIEKIFNFITQNDRSYKMIKANINFCLMCEFNVEVHIVPMTINLYTLDETIKELVEMGVQKINILKLVNQGNCSSNQYLMPDNRILKEEILKLQEKYGDIIRLGLPLTYGKCTAGIDKLVIKCNGEIIPCESYKDGICKCERIVNNE